MNSVRLQFPAPIDPSAPSEAGLPLPLLHPLVAAPTGTILVVDDDAAVRLSVMYVLQGTGYQVACAEDGEAGWEALCRTRFDLLITDHDMPRLKGLDLLRRVRAAPLAVPVILTSGRMPWNEPDLLPLLPPGLALEKPFSVSDLLAKVRSFLSPTTGSGEFQGGITARI